MNTFKQFLVEIDKIEASSWKGDSRDIRFSLTKDWAKVDLAYKNRKPLPGGSDFTYATINNGFDILIFSDDAESLTPDYGRYSPRKIQTSIPVVGHLSLERSHVKGCKQVNLISVVEKYRGQKVGLALYGIVLDILGQTLISGGSQTFKGQQMWANLKSIPGVKVYGLIERGDNDNEDALLKLNDVGIFAEDKKYIAFPVTLNSSGKILNSSHFKIYRPWWQGGAAVLLVAKKVA